MHGVAEIQTMRVDMHPAVAPQVVSGEDFMAFLQAAQQHYSSGISGQYQDSENACVSQIDNARDPVYADYEPATEELSRYDTEPVSNSDNAREAGAVEDESDIEAIAQSDETDDDSDIERLEALLAMIAGLLEALQNVGEAGKKTAVSEEAKEGMAVTMEALKKLAAMLQKAGETPEFVQKGELAKVQQMLEQILGDGKESGRDAGKKLSPSVLQQLKSELEELSQFLRERVSGAAEKTRGGEEARPSGREFAVRQGRGSSRNAQNNAGQSGENAQKETGREMQFSSEQIHAKESRTQQADNTFGMQLQSSSDAAMLKGEARFAQSTGIKQPRQLFEQIVNRAVLTRSSGMSEMKLQLRPRFLGRIQMDLKVEDGAFSAKIIVTNRQLREFLENNLDILGQELRDAGIDVAGMEIGQEAEQSAFSDFLPDGRDEQSRVSRGGSGSEQDSGVKEGASEYSQGQAQHAGSIDLVA